VACLVSPGMDGRRSALGLDTLAFPKQLAAEIGYSAWSIGIMKKAGCRFCGRKSTIRWIREFVGSRPDFKTTLARIKQRGTRLGQKHNQKDHWVLVSGKSDEPRESNGQ
jgi:hypothetical protein